MSSYCEHFSRHLDTARLALVGIRCARPGPDAQPGPTEVRRPMLGFVQHGCGILKTPARQYHATPVDVMLFNPGVAYEVQHEGCEHDRCAVCLDIEPELITEWLSEHGVNKIADAPFGRGIGRVLRSRRTDLLLYRVLAAMRDESGMSAAEELEELLIILGASVLEAVRAGPVPDRRSAAVVRRVNEILAVRYHEALTLDDLAAMAGCSKYHLCRVFSVQTGMTISRFRHRLRINRAMARIMEGDPGFSELSQELGFYSHSHFSTVFRRSTGMTPSGFRASLYGY